MNPQAELRPAGASARYEFLDVLRGFALFGIVIANMILYSLYVYLPESDKAGLDTHAADRVLDFLELALVEGKFFTIFSVLFGIGFSILLTRAAAKGTPFRAFFLKRMLFLYLIGVAHALLVWHDDILQFYAICGALLLPFVSASNRIVLAGSVLALLAPALIELTGAIPPGALAGPRTQLFERFGFTLDSRLAIWTTGAPMQIVRLNLGSWFGQLDFIIGSGMIFKIFGCFLLGFWLGRNEIHHNLPRYRPVIRRLAAAGIIIGLPLNVLYASTFSETSWLHTFSNTFAILPLSTGYAALLCLLWLSASRERLVRVFAPVGRMALTNYVGQSVICMLIFYGIGFGLGGTMGPAKYLPIAVAIYLGQIVASRAWLSRFQFGPLEWLWRILTYGSWIPLRKPALS